MKNNLFLLSIFLFILCGCTSKDKLETKVKHLSGKECEVYETSDGMMYIVNYDIIEEGKFRDDSRELKEYTDKVLGSLPTTELNDVLMNRETLSWTDNIAWETPEMVVLLMKCTDPKDPEWKQYKIKYVIREK